MIEFVKEETVPAGSCHKFGAALELLRRGKKMARHGWNGKDMFVCHMPPIVIPADMVNARTRKFLPDGPLHCGGYFVMWTAQKVWQPGWLASQADMLADDWYVVE